MLTKEEVKHIAKLARLDLTGVEIEKMQKDLSAILDYFNLLKKAGRPPTSTQIGRRRGSTYLRKDEAAPQSRETVEKIIAAAPDKKDDFIKVKTVF